MNKTRVMQISNTVYVNAQNCHDFHCYNTLPKMLSFKIPSVSFFPYLLIYFFISLPLITFLIYPLWQATLGASAFSVVTALVLVVFIITASCLLAKSIRKLKVKKRRFITYSALISVPRNYTAQSGLCSKIMMHGGERVNLGSILGSIMDLRCSCSGTFFIGTF